MPIKSSIEFNRRTILGGGIAGAFMLGTPASAGTVDDIKSRGIVAIGIQGDNPPWGFINTTGVQDGLDADVGSLFAQYLGVKLQFSALAVADRIPALTTGRVDVLFATMAMLPDRAKAVQFSKPYAANTIVLVAAKTDVIKTNQDMGKFTIGVPSSSAQDEQVTKLAPPGTKILRFADDASTIQALLSGQVQAAGGNVGYIDRLEQAKPGVYENKLQFVSLYNGACSRLGDKQMNETLNAFVDKLVASDQYKAIYQKRLHLPMPTFPASIDSVPYTVA